MVSTFLLYYSQPLDQKSHFHYPSFHTFLKDQKFKKEKMSRLASFVSRNSPRILRSINAPSRSALTPFIISQRQLHQTSCLKTQLLPKQITSIHALRHYSTDNTNNSVPDHIDEVSIDEFHKVSDESLETVLATYEDLAEVIPDLDVELAQGVLTLDLPGIGSYVINKQPPNKQIWWSSPISGPKRFDLVDGVWTSLRDGSTLKQSLEEETKIVTEERNLPEVTFEI